MDAEVRAVLDAVRAFAQISDPEDRARKLSALSAAMPDIQAEARRLREGAFAEMYASGLSYEEIGRRFEMTYQRAWQIAHGRTTGRPKNTDS